MALIPFEMVVKLPRYLRDDLEQGALICLHDLDRDNRNDADYPERRQQLCDWLKLLERAKVVPRTWYRRLLEDGILPSSGV